MSTKPERLVAQVSDLVEKKSPGDITKWILHLHDCNHRQYSLLTSQRNAWFNRALYLAEHVCRDFGLELESDTDIDKITAAIEYLKGIAIDSRDLPDQVPEPRKIAV